MSVGVQSCVLRKSRLLENVCLRGVLMSIIRCSSPSSRSLALPSFQLWSSSRTPVQEPFCSSLLFLTAEQRSYCQTNPKIFTIINRSLRLAIEECQYQFRNQRWNCSIFNQSDVFGKLVLRSESSCFLLCCYGS